jgi:hypothetical protein
MATNFPELVPHAIAQEIIGSITDEESSLMQLAHVVQMPSGVETVPVVNSAPIAGFVNPAYGGLKPGSAVDWDALPLTAGEIGTVLGIPNAYLDDTNYPVWDAVRGEIAKAFTKVFELAALYGTAAPTDWPVGGLTAAANATAVTGADAFAAVDAAMSELEGNGITPDGILGGAALRAALRSSMVDTLQVAAYLARVIRRPYRRRPRASRRSPIASCESSARARSPHTSPHTSGGGNPQFAGRSESRMRLFALHGSSKTAWLSGSYVPEIPEMDLDHRPRHRPRNPRTDASESLRGRDVLLRSPLRACDPEWREDQIRQATERSHSRLG